MSSKREQRPRSPEEQRQLSRMGGYLANANVTPEQKRQYGAKGLRLQISRKVDPEGTLARTDPREFERQYTLTLKAHMAELGARHSAAAAERREAKRAAAYAPPMVLLYACPACNEELGYRIPLGYRQELCIGHWLAEKAARFGAVLDEAEAQIAS